jgi:hypothetical protein
MKIYRDGKAIELTREECRQVYDELDKEYKTEDIRGKLEEMEVELDVTDELIDRVDHVLGNNDGYWDSYWCTVEYVIEEYMKEKGML